MLVIQLLCFMRLSCTLSDALTSYFLNSDYTFKTPLPYTSPVIDCVHTNTSREYTLPRNLTMCLRAQPMLYRIRHNPWTIVAGFGRIQTDFSDMVEGLILGVYEFLIWIGLKYKDNDNYVWVSMGKNEFQDLQVWRHLCISIEFETGRVNLVDNGEIFYAIQSEKVRPMSNSINFISIGCFYKSTGNTLYMSMYGRIGDIQLFQRI